MNSLPMRQSEIIPCKTCKAEILNWSQIALKQKLQLPRGTKFLRVLIAVIFPASDPQKEVQAKKNYRKHFPAKNLVQDKYSLT